LSASDLRVGLPLESFIGPLTPDILAQNDFFRALRLPVGLDSVTGAFKLAPVFFLKCALPAAVRPPFELLCFFFIYLTWDEPK
jgi:hypothetical protein